jgi:hypothetical protein
MPPPASLAMVNINFVKIKLIAYLLANVDMYARRQKTNIRDNSPAKATSGHNE